MSEKRGHDPYLICWYKICTTLIKTLTLHNFWPCFDPNLPWMFWQPQKKSNIVKKLNKGCLELTNCDAHTILK